MDKKKLQYELGKVVREMTESKMAVSCDYNCPHYEDLDCEVYGFANRCLYLRGQLDLLERLISEEEKGG